jgi:hypothetical protein
MTDTAYLRRQAELCLAISGLMSHPDDAKLARQAATNYNRRAVNEEQRLLRALRAARNAKLYIRALHGSLF